MKKRDLSMREIKLLGFIVLCGLTVGGFSNQV